MKNLIGDTNEFNRSFNKSRHFLQKLSQKEISLKEPFLIVLIFSILIAISAYISTSIIYKIFPPQYQQVLAFTKIIALISTFIGGIVAWLIIAGFMHLISMIFKGEGSFKKTLSFTGYGFLPNIVGALITIPIAYYMREISQQEMRL